MLKAFFFRVTPRGNTMSFPHRNPHFSNTSVSITVMDVVFATILLYLTIAGTIGVTQGIWHICAHVAHFWWFILQLPVYWVAVMVWLSVIIMACLLLALAMTVYYQVWQSLLEMFSPEDEAY